jgi:APA family basic amino acid/polyamine antiporter
MAGKPEEQSHISTELSRELSLFHITMMGVGMMIGAGVFLGIGNAIHVAGPGGVILTFTLNGVLGMFTAMSYAELSSAVPRAGGAYNFTRIAFGRGPSFLAGWMEWFASSVAGSVYSLTFAIYTLHYFEQLGLINWEWFPFPEYYAQKLVGIIIAAVFIYINYRGASETGKTGAFFTLGQTIMLGIVGIVGLVVVISDPGRLNNFQPFLPHGWHQLLVTMGFTYVAFEGFEVIAQAGDETIEPRKNIPKAMLYSIFIVVTTYILVSFAAIVAVKSGTTGIEVSPWEWIGKFKEKGFGMAVARLMPLGSFVVTLTVIFASTSALNATIYSATRVSYALGRDRMLPGFFAKISKRQKTPYFALIFTSLIVISVATLLPTMDVASSASIMFLFLFFTVNLSVIKIRKYMADELHYGYIMPFFPIIPIAAIACQLLLAVWLVHMSWLAWIVAPTWISSGILIYWLYAKKHAITTHDEIVVLEEQPALISKQYRIMVPVANPENALRLVGNTFKLCGAKDAQVELLHMVPIPEQVPLSDAGKYVLPGKEAITEAMLYLEPRFPITTTIRYCRNVARGIVMAAREKKVDMIIMGWHGNNSYRRSFIFGSTLDPVVEKAPCHVVIFKDCPNQDYKRILVPFAGGPNGALAFEIASILVAPMDSQIVPLNVARPGQPTQDIEAFLDEAVKEHQLNKDLFLPMYLISKNFVEAITNEANEGNYDLVIIGATREKMLKQLIRGTLPEEIARRIKKPLVMVNATEGFKLFMKRII